MNGAEVFYGFVAGVLIASVFWMLFAARLAARMEEELEDLEKVADELDGLEEWHGWGDVPPIPPHEGVG